MDKDNYFFGEIAIDEGDYYVVVYKRSDGGVSFGITYEFYENEEEEETIQ